MKSQLILLRLFCELNLNKDAVILATEMLRVESDNPDIYYFRGLALQNEGNFMEALEDFNRALKHDPKHDGARLQLAGIYLQRTEAEPARELLLALKKTDKKNPEVYHMLGLVSYMTGEEKKAIRYWKKTIKLDSRHVGALENLKLCNINLEEPRTLRETLRQNKIRAKRNEIESKVKELELLEYYEYEPFQLYWGRKGLVFLHKNNTGAFSYLVGDMHHQLLDKKGAKEVIKILLSVVFSKLKDIESEIFIEADYGRGQYFIYHRQYNNELGWVSRQEGKFQEKKVPVFLKSRIISPVKIEELSVIGNLFLMKHDSHYVCFDNWGTESEYAIYDTWQKI